MVFGNFDLIAIFGVAEANTLVFEVRLNVLKVIIKLTLNLNNMLISAVENLVDTRLGLGDFCVVRTCNFLPLDQLIELVKFFLNVIRQQSVLSLRSRRDQCDKPLRIEFVSLPDGPQTINRLSHVLEADK